VAFMLENHEASGLEKIFHHQEMKLREMLPRLYENSPFTGGAG
jgi:hypothetical protein